MAFSISLLIKAVASLFCYMALGFIIRKTKFADDNFSKSLSVFLIYIAQIAMFLHGYIRPFDKTFFTKTIDDKYITLSKMYCLPEYVAHMEYARKTRKVPTNTKPKVKNMPAKGSLGKNKNNIILNFNIQKNVF